MRAEIPGLVAGVLQEVGSIETVAVEEWDRVFHINTRANFLLVSIHPCP